MHPISRPCICGPRSPIDEWAPSGPRRKPTIWATWPTNPSPPIGINHLGGRETEVARPVGAGLTNKEIGARLFISQRTVETHVRNILDRLGFSSRAQIAGWIAAPDA